MNIVVILAGGKGSRMQSNIPKQHIKVNNHQILEYTLKAFSTVEAVDSILVVSNSNYFGEIEALKHKCKKLKWVITGGDTRILSVYNAIVFLQDKCNPTDKIIITDAVRPCVKNSETNELIEKLNNYRVVTTGVEVYETILKTDGNEIQTIIQRDGILRQTSPEGYEYSVLKNLYLERNMNSILKYSNIGLEEAQKMNISIGIVKTSPLNFKITTPDDIYMFETVLRQGFEKYILD